MLDSQTLKLALKQQQNKNIYTEYVQSLSLSISYVYFYISSLNFALFGHWKKDFMWDMWSVNEIKSRWLHIEIFLELQELYSAPERSTYRQVLL